MSNGKKKNTPKNGVLNEEMKNYEIAEAEGFEPPDP